MSGAPSELKRRLALKIGAGAVALAVPMIAFFEGTVLRTYRDPIGIITSCRGHTGPELRMGQVFTVAECDEQQFQDMLKHADDLACIKSPTPLTPGQAASMLSLVYTVGRGRAGVKDGLCVLKSGRPSTIVRSFAAGNPAAACASISSWTGAGGMDCSKPAHASTCGGIVKRRAIERAVCEGKPVVLPPAAGVPS